MSHNRITRESNASESEATHGNDADASGHASDSASCEHCPPKRKMHNGRQLANSAIGNALLIFVVLSALEFVAYFALAGSMPNFAQRYGWWLFYLNVSMATLGVAAWHLYSFKTDVPCMHGMMIGMTVGMQSGMMLGAVVGATNGFFTGSVVGVLIGVSAGYLAGRCCGIMGIMEGMMAGLMGGTMGPMISLMMLSDHILWFMPLYMIVNVVILIGLVKMFLEGVVAPAASVHERKLDTLTLTSLCVIITAVIIAIMVYGPKSAIFG